MSYEIVEKYQAESGFWFVRVAISPDESTFFKFLAEPTQELVDREAEIYALNKRAADLRNATVEQVSPEAKTTRMSKLEYMNRFTDAELAGIYSAAKQSVAVEIWLEKFKLAEFIDKADPLILQGLQALESVGLLAAGRASEILS